MRNESRYGINRSDVSAWSSQNELLKKASQRKQEEIWVTLSYEMISWVKYQTHKRRKKINDWGSPNENLFIFGKTASNT